MLVAEKCLTLTTRLQIRTKCKMIVQVVEIEMSKSKWFSEIKHARISVLHNEMSDKFCWSNTLLSLDFRLCTAWHYNKICFPPNLNSLKLSGSIALFFKELHFPLFLQKLELTGTFPLSRLMQTDWINLSSLKTLSLHVDCNNSNWPCNIEYLQFTGISALQSLPFRLETLRIYPHNYFGAVSSAYISLLSTAPNLKTVYFVISEKSVL